MRISGHVGCAKVGNGQGVDDADISVLHGSLCTRR